jgi:hypothetical protein
LHLDHLDGVIVIAPVGRSAAILRQQALETPIIGFTHRPAGALASKGLSEQVAIDVRNATSMPGCSATVPTLGIRQVGYAR